MTTMIRSRVLLVCFLALCFSILSNGLRFEVSSTGSKCLQEEIQGDVVVLANYTVINCGHAGPSSQGVSAQVTSPYGNSLHQSENVKTGQFAFTSKEAGTYIACFWLANPPQGTTTCTLDIDWKVGVATKDWDSIAKKEKVEGVEFELLRLQSAVEAIHENLIYLKEREAQMRAVSETTNTRVAWYSIVCLATCFGMSLWQIWNLRRFFEKKKLI